MKKLTLSILICALALSTVACTREAPPPATGDESSSATESSAAEVSGEENEAEGLIPEEGAELVFWTHRPNFGAEIAADFEEEYGVPVTVEEVGFDSMSKLTLEGPAGNGADVVWGGHAEVINGYNSGIIAPVDESLAAVMREELQSVAVESATIDGTMYAFPFAIETTALAYNKDLVETPASTYEEIFEAATEFNNVDEGKFYFLNTLGGYAQSALLTAGGFELHGPNGTDNDNPGYDSEGFVQGLEYIAEMAKAMPISAGDLTMAGGDFLQQNFIDGKTAYFQVGPWNIATLDDAGVNYGLIPHPTMDGIECKPFAGVTMNYVSEYTEYPNAAQLFAAYLTSPEAAATLYETDKNITARADYMDIDGLKDDVNLLAFAESFKTATPQPAVPRMSYFWTISDAVIAAVFNEAQEAGTGLTPEAAAAKAQADYEGLVASE